MRKDELSNKRICSSTTSTPRELSETDFGEGGASERAAMAGQMTNSTTREVKEGI